MSLDQGSTTLIGVAIGAIAGLLGGLLTGWRQSRLETQKWLRAREDTVRADTRDALGHLAKTLASAAHSMMWSTYKALNSGPIEPEELRLYEQEFHEAVSDIVSTQMHIAALDQTLFERITPLVSEAIAIGEDTFLALKAALDDPRNESELSDSNHKALRLIKRIPSELSDLLRG
jgi:hypothetical protein